MQILVFKTNLTNAYHIHAVGGALNTHPHIFKWNVDLHDCDNVLRIVAKNIVPEEVETMLTNAGYYCKELDD